MNLQSRTSCKQWIEGVLRLGFPTHSFILQWSGVGDSGYALKVLLYGIQLCAPLYFAEREMLSTERDVAVRNTVRAKLRQWIRQIPAKRG